MALMKTIFLTLNKKFFVKLRLLRTKL